MSLTPAKYKILARLSVLSIIFILFTQDVRAAITLGPQNAVVTAGQRVTFNCTSTASADALSWIESGRSLVTSTPTACQPSPIKRFITTTVGTNTCDVTYLNITTGDAGPISCTDQTNFVSAFATVIVIPTGGSTCGLPSNTAVIQGTNVTIPCRFDYAKQSFFSESPKLPITTYANWTPTNSSNVYFVSPSTPAPDSSSTNGSIVSNIIVTVTGTVLPSFTCVGMFTFTPPSTTDPSFQFAVNSVSTPPCVTPSQSVQYCSTAVSITPTLPANGQILSGSTFSCNSDGFPAPSYTWTIAGGTLSTSSGPNTTITSGGPFNLTCTATATLGNSQSCTASANVSGTSVQCPNSSSSITITNVNYPASTLSLASAVNVRVNDTFNCTTAVTYPAVTSYLWSVDGQLTPTQTQTYVIRTPGPRNLTCTPQLAGTSLCSNASNTVAVFVIDCPTVATITKVTSSANNYSCSATTVATVSYGWTDSVSVPVTSSVLGTGQNYIVPPSTPGYHVLNCTATVTALPVTCNPVSATYNVTVLGCPQNVAIAQQPAGQWVAGQTTLNCTSTGAFPAATYKWYNGSTLLQSGSTFNIATSGYYALLCVATASDGLTDCSSNTTVNNTSNACPQNVTISSNPNGIYTVGDTVTCSSTGGYPTATYQWNPGSVSGSSYTVNSPGSLTLTCTASVPGCQSSATVNITVLATTTVPPTTTALATTTVPPTTAAQVVTTTPSAGAVTTAAVVNTQAAVTTAVQNVQTSAIAGVTQNGAATTVAAASAPSTAKSGDGGSASSVSVNNGGAGSTSAAMNNGGTGSTSAPMNNGGAGSTSAAMNNGGTGSTSEAMNNGGMTTGNGNGTMTTAASNSMNQGAMIAAIVVPSSLGLLALSLLACYYCIAAGLLPDRKDDRQEELQQTASPANDQFFITQIPVNEESSFYAPGYAFNNSSFAAGYGRF